MLERATTQLIRTNAVILTVLLILAVVSFPTLAASPWFGGDWESSLRGVKTDGDWEWDPRTELTLQASLRDSNVRFFADVSGWIEQRGEDWYSDADVNRLYVRMFLPKVDLTLGKQQINWGTGRAWSPSDIFNPPDALNPDRQRNGVTAALLTIPHGPLAYTSMVLAEDPKSDDLAMGMRYHGYTDGIDWSVFLATRKQNPILGGDLAMDLAGLGVHSELTYEPDFPYDDGGRLLWLMGSDYSWAKGKLVWMGEYLYDSTGAKDPKDYKWWRPGVLANATLGRHSLFNQLTYAYDDFNSVSVHLLSNLVDDSQALTLSHTSILDTHLQWDIQATYFLGDPGTEYGSHADIMVGTGITYKF